MQCNRRGICVEREFHRLGWRQRYRGLNLGRYTERSEGGSTTVQLGTNVHSKGWGRCKQNGMEADVQKTDIAGQM